MRKMGILAKCLLLFFLIPATTSAQSDGVRIFRDLPASHWAAPEVAEAVQKGYIVGYPDGTFRPDNQVTRAEFASLLSRAAKHKNIKENVDVPFGDVPEGHWARGAIARAIALGFVPAEKYGTRFEPDRPMTRLEIAEWLANGLAAAREDFAEAMWDTKDTLVPVAEYYKGGLPPESYPHVSIVYGTGIMKGFPDGSFRPGELTKRSEIAAILHRFDKVQGRAAKEFRELNELREVGLYGTNAVSFTDFVFYSPDRVLVFDVPLREDIVYEGWGTFHIHRMILAKIDNEGNLYGVYAPMFLNPEFMLEKRSDFVRKAFLQYEDLNDFIFTFTDLSFTSEVDELAIEDVIALYDQERSFRTVFGYGHFFTVHPDNASRYGIKARSYYESFSYKRGETQRFWFSGHVDEKSQRGFYDLLNAIKEMLEKANAKRAEQWNQLPDEIREFLLEFQNQDLQETVQD